MKFNRLGNYLLKLRNEKGWTQIQLSQITGISRSSIVNYEIGSHDPRLGVLITLLGALEGSLAEVERILKWEN